MKAIEPVNAGKVTFSAPASGAGVALSATSATVVSGAVSVNATANGTTGSYDVSADASGIVAPAIFHLTNISPASPTPSPVYYHVYLPLTLKEAKNPRI